MPAPLADLAAALPPGTLVTDADMYAGRLTDWRGALTGRALALARPASTAEVQAIVRWAAAHRVPLVPQGGNTGMVGGATPDADGRALLVSTERMIAIRALEPDDLAITVEAGVTLTQVRDAAAAAGLRFPLWLGAGDSATVGGLVATNAGGTEVIRHGTMRALVLGLEAVLADGGLLATLGALRKDTAGYDLKQLLIGAEGTLGIVTAATLRLAPAPAHVATAWAGVAGPEQALALLGRLRAAAGEAIEAFELMPAEALALVRDHIPAARPPAIDAPWHVLVELGGGAWVHDALAGVLTDQDAVLAQSQTQRRALWAIREAIPLAERASGTAIKHDISVPVSRLPGFVRDVTPRIEARWPGLTVFAFGHLGDGNLHFNVRGPAALVAAHAEAVRGFVHDQVIAHGGSIAAEHGVGSVKAAELARVADPVRLAAMRALKQALDPLGIMNPGKIIAAP